MVIRKQSFHTFLLALTNRGVYAARASGAGFRARALVASDKVVNARVRQFVDQESRAPGSDDHIRLESWVGGDERETVGERFQGSNLVSR